MNQHGESKSSISIKMDPRNPGQFFACCGLLEIADRLCNCGAEGWFDDDFYFHIKPIETDDTSKLTEKSVLEVICNCHLKSMISDNESKMLDKKSLDKLLKDAPVEFISHDIKIILNWFIDSISGGDYFKTWAGQQSVLNISKNMLDSIKKYDSIDFYKHVESAVPFYFDSDIGAMGSDLDVGFSSEPLKIKTKNRPLVEFLSFIGMQRFRPIEKSKNLYQYSLWFKPMVPEIAAVKAYGLMKSERSMDFEFRLLLRTKYLKSFLTSTQTAKINAEQFIGEVPEVEN